MRIVIVAWVLTVVTLICVALAVAFWTECSDDGAVYRAYERGQALSQGWRPVIPPNGDLYLCRPRLYRLFGY